MFFANTIGTFYTHKVELEDDSIVKFNVWDTAGEERFRTIVPLYYRGAAAAIVVYEVTSYPSLQSAKQWIEELKERGEPSMIIALVGNKIDLQPTKDTVTFREADAYADEKDLLHFRTSAKTGQDVKEVFVEIAQRLPKPDCVPPDESESEPLALISRDPVANDRSLAKDALWLSSFYIAAYSLGVEVRNHHPIEQDQNYT